MTVGTPSPLWLRSPAVAELLNLLVDRLDGAERRGSAKIQAISLGERSWPSLYRAERESEKEALWDCVLEMVRWRWLAVRPDLAGRSRASYAHAPRVMVTDEAAVRSAAGREQRMRTAAERWQVAVQAGLQADSDVRTAVAAYCIDLRDHSMSEVVERLNKLPTLAAEPLLLREVSSRLFWGLSKVLDKRQGLVAALLQMDECPFPESPIQLQVCLPPDAIGGVLFIENLVTFERATRSSSECFKNLALVYAAGFKGSAQRLRRPEGCSVYYSARGALDIFLRTAFEDWLLRQGGANGFHVCFWGDLDWEGMRILCALRASFPSLSAWAPGYAPLLAALHMGQSHLPEDAAKTGQRPVLGTGCSYADQALIPALTATGRFVDQEAFEPVSMST